MEVGIIASHAYWGLHTGGTAMVKLALAVVAPALVFGFWGFVDFHQMGQSAELLRLVQELTLSFLAAVAVYAAGQRIFGCVLAVVSIVHHLIIYAVGEKLLKH